MELNKARRKLLRTNPIDGVPAQHNKENVSNAVGGRAKKSAAATPMVGTARKAPASATVPPSSPLSRRNKK